MNRMLNFVREKAFALILLGSMVAAVVTGLWAMNTVQNNLNQSSELEQSEGLAGGEEALVPEGDSIWNEAADIVTDEMNGEIAMDQATTSESTQSEENSSTTGASSAAEQAAAAEQAVVLEPGAPTDGANGQDLPPDSSTQASGASSSSEPSEASAILEPQSVTVTPSFVLPVSGAILQSFSGDELVYNETLGDWRTHNGTDYAAALGEEVICPITGQVISVSADGNWGGVVEVQAEDGTLWRFCGVENSTLQAGDAISISQVLGNIGTISAESAAEPHLHLEILVDGDYQDPALYLK